jgi:hypothetical protein
MNALAPLPEPLRLALEQGERMLELARAQDWGALAELQAEQSGLLAHCFNTPADTALGPVLHRLLELNEETARLTEAARRVCLEELTRLDLGERAQRAYTVG